MKPDVPPAKNKEEEKPKTLEEANSIIENLKKKIKEVERWGTISFMIVSSLIMAFERSSYSAQGHKRTLIENEFKNLKRNVEQANFYFQQYEANKAICEKDKNYVVGNGAEKMQEALDNTKKDAFVYITQAQASADSLNNILK